MEAKVFRGDRLLGVVKLLEEEGVDVAGITETSDRDRIRELFDNPWREGEAQPATRYEGAEWRQSPAGSRLWFIGVVVDVLPRRGGYRTELSSG